MILLDQVVKTVQLTLQLEALVGFVLFVFLMTEGMLLLYADSDWFLVSSNLEPFGVHSELIFSEK